MMREISTNSWHYKFLKWINESEPHFNERLNPETREWETVVSSCTYIGQLFTSLFLFVMACFMSFIMSAIGIGIPIIAIIGWFGVESYSALDVGYAALFIMFVELIIVLGIIRIKYNDKINQLSQSISLTSMLMASIKKICIPVKIVRK